MSDFSCACNALLIASCSKEGRRNALLMDRVEIQKYIKGKTTEGDYYPFQV